MVDHYKGHHFIRHKPLISEEYILYTYIYQGFFAPRGSKYIHINIFHICLHIHPLFHIFPGVKLTATKLDFLPQSRLFSHRRVVSERKKKKSYEMREENHILAAAFSHYFPFFFYAHPYPFCNTLLPSRGSVR